MCLACFAAFRPCSYAEIMLCPVPRRVKWRGAPNRLTVASSYDAGARRRIANQVARASASEACSDKTSRVASRTADHLEVIELKATPKVADLAPIERCFCNPRCMTISIDWVQPRMAS